MNICIFLFHRDFRLTDNTTLINAVKQGYHVLPVFIFTPQQVTSQNAYLSKNSVQFMIESLEDLANQIRVEGGHLYTFMGNTVAVLKTLIIKTGATAIAFNTDITPFAKARDKDIAEKLGITVISNQDYYLLDPGSILKPDGKPYHKFTPYYNMHKTHSVTMPSSFPNRKVSPFIKPAGLSSTIKLSDAFIQLGALNAQAAFHGGRTNALIQLRQNLSNYGTTRNLLSENTSLLSAFIKFGCISIREVYHAHKRNREFTRQLVWRDFYASLLHHHPEMVDPTIRTLNIRWNKSDIAFQAWANGQTGFPVVDACMRQLNTTGYMHNRGRLIVASFLVKTLLIDWRKGERYFAQKLLDYDVASNNGNWRWISGEGIKVDNDHVVHFDSQPYFRIFNPWNQAITTDPDAIYIKRWIPELAQIDKKRIHKWYEERVPINGYPLPMIDYVEEKKHVLEAYANTSI
jgi:deoxyribodipyrimidine photo-lyase